MADVREGSAKLPAVRDAEVAILNDGRRSSPAVARRPSSVLTRALPVGRTVLQHPSAMPHAWFGLIVRVGRELDSPREATAVSKR